MALDLFKNVSSKLTVNNLVKVDMMMILGVYRFIIKNAAYQTLKRHSTYRWQEINRIGSNTALQFSGFGVEIIEIEGIIYPHFKGGLKQIALMRAEAGFGKPLFLISGNGFAFGRWCITKISENQSNFLSDGSPRKIEFNLTLKRYGEDKKKGVKGMVQNIITSL